nr:peptidyl-tRNA hydrolase ICT1, mitochondrial [Tanacetum cinerariifolium]
REAYRKRLAEGCNMNRTRILAFKNKPLIVVEAIPRDLVCLVRQSKTVKARRYIPHVLNHLHNTSERTMFSRLLLGTPCIYGCYRCSDVQLWDSAANRLADINLELEQRIRTTTFLRPEEWMERLLKWSAYGQQLASGGNENLFHIWDRCMASANAPTQKRGNIEDALEKLHAIIDAASYVPPPPSEEQVKNITKIAAAAENKRLQNKKVLSQKKAFRRSQDSYD